MSMFLWTVGEGAPEGVRRNRVAFLHWNSRARSPGTLAVVQKNWLVEEVERRGAMAVIPSKRNRKVPRDHDGEMYKWRHQVENFLAKIKEFRAIAKTLEGNV